MSTATKWVVAILVCVLVCVGLHKSLGFEHRRKSRFDHE